MSLVMSMSTLPLPLLNGTHDSWDSGFGLRLKLEQFITHTLGPLAMDEIPVMPTLWQGDYLRTIVQLMPYEVRQFLVRHHLVDCKQSIVDDAALDSRLKIIAAQHRNADEVGFCTTHKYQHVFDAFVAIDREIVEDLYTFRSEASALAILNPSLLLTFRCDHRLTNSVAFIGWWETFGDDEPPLAFTLAQAQHNDVDHVKKIFDNWSFYVGKENDEYSLFKRCHPIKSGCTIAHHAALHSQSPEMMKMLITPDVNDSNLKTIYPRGIHSRSTTLVKYSAEITSGINLYNIDASGNNLLHYAARNPFGSDIIRHIQNEEMKRNISNCSSIDAFSYSLLTPNDKMELPLHLAAGESSLETFRTILRLLSIVLKVDESVVIADRPEIGDYAARNIRSADGSQILSAILYRLPDLYHARDLLSVAIESNNVDCISYLTNFLENNVEDYLGDTNNIDYVDCASSDENSSISAMEDVDLEEGEEGELFLQYSS